MTFLQLMYLPKQKGGRLENVSTFRAYCKEKLEKSDGATSWIKVTKTIKLPESDDLFGHVALAQMEDMGNMTDIVVKVYDNGDFMLEKEKTILTTLNKYGFQNVIRLICTFDCDKEIKIIWYDEIVKKRVLCTSTGKYKLSFLVMEYIPNGNIQEFMKNNTMTNNKFKSYVKQACLFLLEIHHRLRIHHGDIHSGNILVDLCEEQKVCSYRISNKRFDIMTHGVMPIFIDFGRASRSSSSKSSSSNSSCCSIKELDNICWCMQEILVFLQMMKWLSPNQNLKKWVKMIYEEVAKFDKTQTLACAEKLYSI